MIYKPGSVLVMAGAGQGNDHKYKVQEKGGGGLDKWQRVNDQNKSKGGFKFHQLIDDVHYPVLTQAVKSWLMDSIL